MFNKCYQFQSQYADLVGIRTQTISLCCTEKTDAYIDGLVQDCSISIANAWEILQSCTEPPTYSLPDSFTWNVHKRYICTEYLLSIAGPANLTPTHLGKSLQLNSGLR